MVFKYHSYIHSETQYFQNKITLFTIYNMLYNIYYRSYLLLYIENFYQ